MQERQPTAFTVPSAAGSTLAGEDSGGERPVVLLHGLSATRRNVVQGSRHLAKRGHRTIGFDARGHGESEAASGYAYPELVADLDRVLAELSIDRPALVGSSMGAHTAAAFAFAEPDRVSALVLITP